MQNSLTHTTLSYPIELNSMGISGFCPLSISDSILPTFTTPYAPAWQTGWLLRLRAAVGILPLKVLKTLGELSRGSKGSRGTGLIGFNQMTQTNGYLVKPGFPSKRPPISDSEILGTFPEMSAFAWSRRFNFPYFVRFTDAGISVRRVIFALKTIVRGFAAVFCAGILG